MSVGNQHYAVEYILPRHFVQTAERAGLPGAFAANALKEIAERAPAAMAALGEQLPPDFPEALHASVQKGFLARVAKIE